MSDVLHGSLIIGQSGGPTSVINASAYGVIKTALEADCITRVYGAHYGIRGVLDDSLFIMDEEDRDELKKLMYTPSSALGSCRYKLKDPSEDDSDYKRILEIFQKYDVRYFCYNGGNDSMDTCNKISKYMQSVGYECRIMGVPKTIDNDLYGIDNCPGYGSAAKYIATTVMEVARDTAVYNTGQVTIIECMGRHAGWLTAAAALANMDEHYCDFIYLPERVFDMEKFISDVEGRYEERGNCVVAVSEGIRYADGSFVSEAKTSGTDGFGHAQLGGLAARLASIIKERLGCKTRGIELSLLQRCAAHIASKTDVNQAFKLGEMAVKAMLDGMTDKMVAFDLVRDGKDIKEYIEKYIDLSEVANAEKKIPDEWISKEGNDVMPAFIDYALPLIQGESDIPIKDGLPDFANLKRIIAN